MSGRRRWIALALCLVAARPGKPVTWIETQAPSTLHPLFAASSTDLRAQAPVYDRLVVRGASGWTSPIASLVSVDRGVARLTLRRDVRWHDGEALGADDVCATIAAIRDRSRPSPLGARLGPRLQHCAVLPTDPLTAVIHLAATDDPDPYGALDFPVLPAHLGDLADPAHRIATAPIGTGPWRAEPAGDGWRYTPVAAPHHPQGRPPLALRVVDPDKALAEIERGDADGWPTVPAEQVAALRSRNGVALTPTPLGAVLYVALDVTEPPLSDVGIRRSLDTALNRQAMCDALVGTWPGADPPPCRPVAGPYRVDAPETNHGVVFPEPAPLPPTTAPVPLTVAIPDGLEVDPDRLCGALAAAWTPYPVSCERLPLAELLALGPKERRTRFTAIVGQRLPAAADLRPELAPDGGFNWFGLTDPDLVAQLGARDAFDKLALHADLYDRRIHLYLFQVDGMAAWRDDLQPLWMTPTDGLGSISQWGFSGAAPGPRR